VKLVARRETFNARANLPQAFCQSEVARTRVTIAGPSDAAVVCSTAAVSRITTWRYLIFATVTSSTVQSVAGVLNDVEEADVLDVTLALVRVAPFGIYLDRPLFSVFSVNFVQEFEAIPNEGLEFLFPSLLSPYIHLFTFGRREKEASVRGSSDRQQNDTNDDKVAS